MGCNEVASRWRRYGYSRVQGQEGIAMKQKLILDKKCMEWYLQKMRRGEKRGVGQREIVTLPLDMNKLSQSQATAANPRQRHPHGYDNSLDPWPFHSGEIGQTAVPTDNELPPSSSEKETQDVEHSHHMQPWSIERRASEGWGQTLTSLRGHDGPMMVQSCLKRDMPGEVSSAQRRS